MAPSQGGPDAVDDKKGRDRHTYGGVATTIHSARPRNWRVRLFASSQRVVPRSRGSAMLNKQRHHTRTAYTERKRKSTAAVPRYGGQGSTLIAQSDWLIEFLMVFTPLPHGACGLWLQWTERRMRAERGAVRSSSISVGCDTNNATSSDRLQQRPSPSATAGAFLLHRRRHAPSLTPTQRGSNSHTQPPAPSAREVTNHTNAYTYIV
ncbi:hypothetical protein TcCL_ESM09203 [Trypanosoma cruzi]|nr:hypothetical protein TcCL_ESM09203 [Trypanosoma cruzi]